MCSSVSVRKTCAVAVKEDGEPTDELRPLDVTRKSCNETLEMHKDIYNMYSIRNHHKKSM